MARRPGGDPYGQDDFTNDNGVTPDPYGTVRQPVGTQPAAGTTPQPGPSTGTNPNPYANGGTTPINVKPGLKISLGGGQVAGSGLPTGTPPDGWTPQYAPGTDPSKMDFGDLTNPTNWMGLVGNDSQLNSWVTSVLGPNAKPSDVAYWSQAIKGKPGANPTEQAGSAAYWKDRMLNPSAGGDNGTTPASQSSPFLDTFRNGLLDRLKQLQQPTDPNSDAIRLPTDAYNLSSDRGLEATKRNQAQAAYAGHSLNTGGYQQVQTQADEQNAADKANFTGNLVSSAEQQRQSRLDALLGLGSGQGTTEELAGGQLGYAYSALKAQRDRDAILAALGTYGG